MPILKQPANAKPRPRRLLVLTFATACQVLSLSCQDATDSGRVEFGTESHFLKECERDSDCGSLDCLDGSCSLRCESDAACEDLASNGSCGDTPAGRRCVVECTDDPACDGLGATTCAAGFCGGYGSSGGADGAAAASDDMGTASDPDAAVMTPQATGADPSGTGADSTEADSGSLDPPEAGFATPSDAGMTDPAVQRESGVASTDAGSVASSVERHACTTTADCLLATRMDVCCPDCPEAVAVAYAEAEQCVYAEGEELPQACTPEGCPEGCPGAACDGVLQAVCAAGECAAEVQATFCEVCAPGEVCVFGSSSGSYECVMESCEFDRCHPERCDQIGERCCDPLPGDGVNYCNAGLACGTAGCEAPADTAPARVCGATLCAADERCCDKCAGTCIDALSGANCVDDNNPDRVCANEFECGSAGSCDASTQYCSRTSVGPSPQSFAYRCTPLPDACTSTPSCDCWTTTGQYGACSELDGGGLIIDYLGE